MYVPAHFEETDAAEVGRVVADHPLAMVVAHTPGGIVANHLPLMFDGAERLIGHVALANAVHEVVDDGAEVLVVFRGQDAYVSPNWYPTKADHHRHVPTWNYQVVHMACRIRFDHGARFKRRVVGLLTQRMEAATNGADAWRMADAPAPYLDDMLDRIVGLELSIERTVAKTKASQNREPVDAERVERELRARGAGELAARVKPGS